MEKETLVEIIIFALVFLLILLPVGWGIYTIFAKSDAVQGTIKSKDALVVEINNIITERTVPVYVDEDSVIKVYKKGGPTGDCYADQSCICVCKKDTCDRTKKEIVVCRRTDIRVDKDYLILPIAGEKQVQNCMLKATQTKEDSKDITIVSISGCVQ